MKQAINYLRNHDVKVHEDGYVESDSLPTGEDGLVLVDTLEDKFEYTIINNFLEPIEC
jgi:hypothetical protein